MSKELMSSAGSFRNKDVASLYMPWMAKGDVLDRMLKVPGENGFSSELMLFSPMMSVANLRHIRSEVEGRIGNGDTIYWHFPKFHGWYPNKDFIPFVEQLTKISSDPVGFLFYLPYLRNIVSPASESRYIKAIEKWDQIFKSGDDDREKNGKHVITVHDYTIFDRDDEGNLKLNSVGEKLKNLAFRGFKVSVELAAEGLIAPVGCPTPGHINSFLQECYENGFGLTLDTYNLWSIVSSSGGWIDDYFDFFGKVIKEAKLVKVPIHLVHFKPFDISTSTQAVAPDKSPFSYHFLRNFLNDYKLSEVPISFEIKRKNLPDDLRNIFVTTPDHKFMKGFITG